MKRPKIERYVLARLNDASAREAAELAGYLSNPPPEARTLAQSARGIDKEFDPEMLVEGLERELAEMHAKIERLKNRIAEKQRTLRAARLTQEA